MKCRSCQPPCHPSSWPAPPCHPSSNPQPVYLPPIPFPNPSPKAVPFSPSLSLSPPLSFALARTHAQFLSLSLSLSLSTASAHTLALSHSRLGLPLTGPRCVALLHMQATLPPCLLRHLHTRVCVCVCVCVGGGGRAHGIWNGCKVWVLGVCLNVHHNVCAHTPVSRNFFSTSTSSTSSLDMWSMEEGTERPNFWQLRRPDSAHPEPVLRRSSCGGRADASAWAAAGRRLAGAKDTLYDCGAHASSASAARANGPRGSQSRYLCVCSRERHDRKRNAYKHCVAVPENGDDRNWGARLIS